ncbi:MAG: DUF5717 family protein [Lachnospiraceae bacterium]|jgi:hypothetical protein|nr:DUF5717 family protein [Lachnospiraceae bacterium]
MGNFHTISGRMSGEQFHVKYGDLTFSEESVNISVKPGAQAEGAFTVYGPPGVSADGFVTSSCVSMQLVTDEFAGAADEITWRFDAEPFSEGDIVEGYFRIISNQGEYKLPFRAAVETPAPGSSIGPITDLPHFAGLAKSSWDEALQLFYDPAFGQMLASSGTGDELELWRGLSAVTGNAQNLEEFLIAVHRKTAIEYYPEVPSIRTDVSAETAAPIEYYFRLTRNGWGCTQIDVTTEGDFLSPVKGRITQDDFSGSSCEVHYILDPSRMHAGINCGAVRLRGAFADITIPVEAAATHCSADPGYQIRREYRLDTVKIVQYYEDYRARKMNGREWLAQTGVVVDRMTAIEPDDPAAALYRVHLDITAGQTREAAWGLDDFDSRFGRQRDPEIACYREYLGALVTGGGSILDTCDASDRVEAERRKNPYSWRIAWLSMYLSDSYRKRPSMRWETLQQLYAGGVRSPILYLEAMQLVSVSPPIIGMLDDFAVQVLWYAARKDMLTVTVMTQVNQLALRQKTFSKLLFRILVRAYEAGLQRENTLMSICTLLIRGNMASSEYFDWFGKGVEAQLPITRLFEFYMLSLPDDFEGEIPQEVLLYFCYQSTLPFEQTARLYMYMDIHREEYPELFAHYLPAIRRFTSEQVDRERISRPLCYLYGRYLDEGAITRENAPRICAAVFSCALHTNRPELELRQVILCYDRCTQERTYPVKDGECLLPVYGEENHIFFADAAGNRYTASVAGIYERLCAYGEVVPRLQPFDTGIPEFDMYLAGLSGDTWKITQSSAERFRRLSDSDMLRSSCRQEIRMKLLHYYDESDLVRDLDAFLASISPEGLSAKDRNEIIRYLVMRGLHEKALEWVRHYGTFGADPAALYRLVTRILGAETAPGGEVPAEIVHEVFAAGKYDETMLLYMQSHFEGLTSELEDVRAASENFGTDTTVIVERMLVQMLYSGVLAGNEEKLIDEFAVKGGSADILSAVLAQVSHYSFVDEVTFGSAVYKRIGDMGRAGTPMFDICRMAFLKEFARTTGEMAPDDLKVAKLFLGDLLEEGIVFPFYRRFTGLLPALQEYADQTMLQFRGRAKANVLLHYTVDRESSLREDYRTVAMKEMYDGVYVTGMVLFFGEQVRYFITDDVEQKNTVESGTFGQDTRIQDEGGDRFALINRVSMYTALKKYDEALDILEDYDRKAYMVNTLFNRS